VNEESMLNYQAMPCITTLSHMIAVSMLTGQTWLSFFLLFSLVIKDGENRSEVSHPSRKTDGKSKIKG
jgi:hypothetical protein